jgi:ATP-binding protein involved in chromosome partitioning
MGNSPITAEQVLDALRTVEDPEIHRDIVSLDFVRDIQIRGKDVSFTVTLTTPACPLKGKIEEDCISAVRARVPGAGRVTVAFDSRVRADRRIQEKLNLPIRSIIAVGSGKGGVGKSTVSANLAVALAGWGAKVGLLDADIYGPNIPTLMGLDGLPEPEGEKLVPAMSHGVKVMSIGFLVPEEEAMVWRGPMIHGTLNQLLTETLWGELDYLIVDLPPGTGDAQLSIAQLVPLSGGIVVTTPQLLSVSDARRGVTAFRRLGVPLLGIVENMSGGVFGTGGGEAAARELCVPFLARIPLDPQVPGMSDRGLPPAAADGASPTGPIFRELARAVAAAVSMLAFAPGAPEGALS